MVLLRRFVFIFIFFALLTACGGKRELIVPDPSLPASEHIKDDTNDPWEGFNRAMFATNLTLDRWVLKPLAKGYRYVPRFARSGIRGFLQNLASPIVFFNDFLQGEIKRAHVTLARFAINSTLGLFGLIDVAKYMGLERHTEDFGQTLGVYGVGEGPYFYLPIIGARPPRDFVGVFVDSSFRQPARTYYATPPGVYIVDNSILDSVLKFTILGIDSRANNLEVIDEIERSSVDFYVSVRSLYRQNRAAAIKNGVLDIDDLPDLDDDFDFDE